MDYKELDMDMDMEWNGFKIKKYRILRGLSQNQLAKEVGITQPTIAKLEMGASNATKYKDKMTNSFRKWKDAKVKELRDEIEFIETF